MASYEGREIGTARPLVSICIPAYNQTDFLRSTLNSIKEQEFRDFEVIVSDDSVNDDVEQLVSEFKGAYKIVYQRNAPSLGSPSNWNMAMALASGRLIKIMHHDDWFSGPESLSAMVTPFLSDPSLNFLFCASKVKHMRSGKTTINAPGPGFLRQLSADPRVLFRYNLIGAPSATIFRKTAERFDEKLQYLVDVDFYIRLLRDKKKFLYLDKPLIVNTADHPGQVTEISKNTRIQVGEHLHLYHKIYPDRIPSISLSWFFINLFDGYQMRRIRDAADWGYELPRRPWFFSFLLLLGKLKRAVRFKGGLALW